jgi:hypothetical protein
MGIHGMFTQEEHFSNLVIGVSISNKDNDLKHYIRYNKKTLKKTIEEFTLVEMSYFNALLFIPIIAIT